MLTHTAGLPEYRTDAEKCYYGQGSDLDKLASAKLTDKQGSYEYSNTGYFLLKKIIEEQTGQKFSDLMYKYVTEPRGLTSVGFLDKHENNPKLIRITHKPNEGERIDITSFDPSIRYALPDGGLFSNVFDLHKLYSSIAKDPNFREAHNRIKVPTGDGSFYGLGIVQDGTRHTHSGTIPMFYTSYASYDCESGSFLGVLSTLKNTETNQLELIQKIENAQAKLA
jgi:CubicO group peptidase (beta-lactamase class C family)